LLPPESRAADEKGPKDTLSTVVGLRAWRMAFAGPVEIWYFSVFYLSLATDFRVPILSVLALVFSLVLYEAWGVLLNDIFDREVDISAGKSGRKRGHTLSPSVMWGLVVSTAVISWTLILVSNPTTLLLGTWTVAYVLGILYSAPPFRFKNRGLLSLICNSVLERPLPVLVIFLFYRYHGPEAVLFPVISELVWSVFKHQVHDYDEDLKANVRTFAVQIGRDASYKVVKFAINPLGVLSVVAFAGAAAIKIPGLSSVLTASIVVIAAGVVVMVVLERLSVVYTDPLDPPYMLFLNFAFLVTVVLVLAGAVVVRQPTYFPVVVLFLLSLPPHMRYYLPMFASVTKRFSKT
jgi:4-hydroxybenzoate polyprenyltransferase